MSYTKSVTLPVSPDEAFALITQPERLRRWMTVSAYVDLRAGGDYHWTVTPGHHVSGTVHEVEPGRRVVLGWGWGDDDSLPADASTVTVTIEPTDGGSRVTLEHSGLPDEMLAGHAEGWDHFLDRLEQLATTGDAGQDPWAWAPENLSPTVAAEAALSAIQPVLRAIGEGDTDRATPCPELPVGALVDHLVASMVGLGGMVGATVEETQGSAEERVSTAAGQAIDAWRGADLELPVQGPLGEMPGSVAAALISAEILLHGWDLAEGLGMTVEVANEVVAYIRSLSEPILPMARPHSFAEEVPAPAGATALESFAAFAGRRAMASAAIVNG